MTNSELKEIEKSTSPYSTHIFIFGRFEEFGYNSTQDWIRQSLMEWEWDKKYIFVKDYLKKRVEENEKLEPYKEVLLSLSLELNSSRFESWVYEMKKKGFEKQAIFEILSELFIFIQHDTKTKDNETYADLLSDFLDRFTAWGKHYRIFPDEPDCF